MERFLREARAAASLSHPNIVAVFDSGTDGELQYLVMEHVPGESLAQLLHRQGRLAPRRAAELALAAAALAEAVGAVVEAARSRTLAGRALAQSGQREEALHQLGRAEAELAASGAEDSRREAAAELRRLGRRVRKRPAGSVGLSSLTEREQEIAALVAEGWTNRQVATRLFISDKTVETHVSHILAKAGVQTRTGLAAKVLSERHGQPFSSA